MPGKGERADGDDEGSEREAQWPSPPPVRCSGSDRGRGCCSGTIHRGRARAIAAAGCVTWGASRYAAAEIGLSERLLVSDPLGVREKQRQQGGARGQVRPALAFPIGPVRGRREHLQLRQ
jgi:hypothetical protein